jgi:hypothetical protein
MPLPSVDARSIRGVGRVDPEIDRDRSRDRSRSVSMMAAVDPEIEWV